MSYFLIKRTQEAGVVRFPQTLAFETIEECVRHATDDQADYLIQDADGAPADYRIGGTWKI